jgi:small subunit ribosomal protein S11
MDTPEKTAATTAAETPKDSSAAAAAALAGTTEGEAAAAPKKRRKVKRLVKKARACIKAGENNTIVSITDMDGNVLAWSSSGSSGFEGTRKSTPYAAKVAAENAAMKVAIYGVETLQVEMKGIGPGREQAIRGLQAAGLNLDAIIDVTPIAHGGCRRPRRRRV